MACQDLALLAQLSAFKDYLTICNAGPSELLGALALRHGETLIARCRTIVLENLAIADGFVRRHPDLLSWVRPTAGTCSLVRVAGDDQAGIFSRRLLQATGVLVMAGSDFEYRDTHFRLGLGRRNFPQAVAEIERWLAVGQHLKDP